MARKEIKYVTKSELALHLGVTPETIYNYQKKGMPVYEEGKGGKSNLYDVYKSCLWVAVNIRNDAAGNDDGKTAKDVYEEYRAKREKLSYLKDKELVLPKEVIDTAISDSILRAKSKLSLLPRRISAIAFSYDNENGLRIAIEKEVNDVLKELANVDYKNINEGDDEQFS